MIAPGPRRFLLTAHISSSVGWLGAAAVVLALAVVGLTSRDAQTVRAVYLVTAPVAWSVLVPLASASLLTGLIQALGTVWGLFRHYWVLFKLLMNVVAFVVLLTYAQTLSYIATVASDRSVSDEDFVLRQTPSTMIHSGGAVLLLLVATVLAVYKPRGMTRYGQRRQDAERRAGERSRPEPLTAPVP